MLVKIAYFDIFGFSVIMLVGIITLLLFIFAATIPLLRPYGINLPFAWHKRVAVTAIILAVLHGFLAIFSH